MPTWRDLERDFHSLEVTLRSARLDIEWEASSAATFRLAASFDTDAGRRFGAFAGSAGEKLSAISADSQHFREIVPEPDPELRWYHALWKMSGAFEWGFRFTDLDEEGNEIIRGYSGG